MVRSNVCNGAARSTRRVLATTLAALLGGVLAPVLLSAAQPPAAPHYVPAGMKQPGRPEIDMATYVFGLLKRGPNAPAPGTEPTEAAKQLQAAHLEHLGSMWEQGKLVGAGPIAQDGDLRGIVLFSGVTLDEAKALAEQDPKVKAGVLQVELHPWMAATGIGVAYNQRVARGEQPSMITLYLGFLRAAKDAPTIDAAALEKLQQTHLDNIARLGRAGSLPLAGPFLDDGELRGVFVFKAASLDAARELAATDPMVQSKHLALELVPWMVADGVMPPAPAVPNSAGN